MKHTEIERKWLLDAFPGLPVETAAKTEQGYLAFRPNTVRIRRHSWVDGRESFVLCIKGPGTLQRTEVELPLDRERYEALYPLVETTVRKDYRTYRLPGGERLECSHVDPGEPGSFLYAEVEFSSGDAARAFQPPAFLGREVTEAPEFTMAAYCRRKLAAQGIEE